MAERDADLAGLRVKAHQPLFDLSLFGLEPLPLGTCLGKRGCRLAQGGFGAGKRFCGTRSGFAKLRLLVRARACRGELAALLAEPAQHAVGFGDMLLLASEVARSLREPRLELGLSRLGARFLALERIALHAQAMEHCRTRGLLVAQRLELLRRLGLLSHGLALRRCLLRNRAAPVLERSLLLLDMGASGDAMEVMLERFRCADLAGDLAVALRLARLTPQLLQLG